MDEEKLENVQDIIKPNGRVNIFIKNQSFEIFYPQKLGMVRWTANYFSYVLYAEFRKINEFVGKKYKKG